MRATSDREIHVQKSKYDFVNNVTDFLNLKKKYDTLTDVFALLRVSSVGIVYFYLNKSASVY